MPKGSVTNSHLLKCYSITFLIIGACLLLYSVLGSPLYTYALAELIEERISQNSNPNDTRMTIWELLSARNFVGNIVMGVSGGLISLLSVLSYWTIRQLGQSGQEVT